MLKLSDLALRPDLQLGPMLVSPSRRLVEGPGGHTHLEPLIMQVFLLLLDARGKVVTRTELFDQCWGGVMVGDDSLNRAIAKVRRTGAHVAPGLYEIETIPRTGYRLTGEILQVMDDGGDGPQGTKGTSSGTFSRRTLVVSAAAVAAAGGAWALLSPRSNPEFDRLFARADQILRYDLPDTTKEAVKVLRQAVALEPRNAAAWGLLAYALAYGGDDDVPAAENIAATEDAIRTALALDPREPNALFALQMFRNALRDWIETDRNTRSILQIDPRNTFAMRRLVAMLQAAGLDKESWDWNERAIAIDPMAPIHQYRKALKYWIYGRIQKADVTADELMLSYPGHPWVWNARFAIYSFTGRAKAALDILENDQVRPKSISPAAIDTWRVSLEALDTRSPRAIAAARQANFEGARLGPGLAAYGVMVLSALGEVDAAYDIANGVLLGRGPIISRQSAGGGGFVQTAGWRMTQWLFTPPVAAMRADRRFTALCDGIGLTAYWKARGIRPDYLA